MNAMQIKLEADVRKLLAQGADPAVYAKSLASLRGVTLDAVTAAIAAVGGTPRKVSAETVAQERLAEDRRYASSHPAAWRQANHEQE